MEQWADAFKKSFSAENEEEREESQKNILEHIQHLSPTFFENSFLILQDSSIDYNIRHASAIYLSKFLFATQKIRMNSIENFLHDSSKQEMIFNLQEVILSLIFEDDGLLQRECIHILALLFYFNTNLIYEDMSLLYKVLDRFCKFDGFCKNGHWKCFVPEDRVYFTTSYDIAYRYRIEEDRHLVEQNLKTLSRKYPNIEKTANFILTDKGCEFLLNNPEFPREFQDEYGCRLNPIPYIILDPAMAASRKTVQQTLLALNYADPHFLKSYIRSMNADRERVLLEYDGTKLINASSKNAPCGHNENFRRVYKGDDRCFICDCMNMAKSLGI